MPLVLPMDWCLCLVSACQVLLEIVNVFMFTFFSDLKEQLKCVLSPYQKGTAGTDVDGRLRNG